VAADIGITKAALYRYFRNKETLFLALFVETLGELVQSFRLALKQCLKSQEASIYPPPSNVDNIRLSLAHLVTTTLVQNSIYCKLSAILHTILERNLTLDEANEFKQQLLTLMNHYSQLLTQHPEFKKSSAIKYSEQNISASELAISYLMQIQQALIGVWHMSHPTGAIAKVIEVAPLNIFKQDFSEALLAHIIKITDSQLVQ
jgi:AcrR family transcriptional regulator